MDEMNECIACGAVIESELYCDGTEICGDCDEYLTDEQLECLFGDCDHPGVCDLSWPR